MLVMMISMMMVNNDNDVDVATGDASTIADIANKPSYQST